MLIRNIGTVPFEEIFDLLRAAPVDVRQRWIQELSNMPQGPPRSAAISSFYKTYVQLDPRAAVASITALHDRDTLWLVVDSMIGAAPLSAMPEIAKMLTTLPEGMLFYERMWLNEVMDNWSKVDPAEAAKFIDANPSFPLDSLLTNWGQADPKAALDWFSRRPLSDSSAFEFRSLVGGWFEQDRAAAIAFTVAHSGEKVCEEATKALTQQLFFLSPDDARDFLVRLPAEVRKASIDELTTVTNGRVLGGSESWQRPPEVMANWLLTLPKDSWSGGIATVLCTWVKDDATAAAGWINRLPSDQRDQAIVAYAQSANDDDHMQTIALAMTISDSAKRDSVLRDYLCSWLSRSRKDAIKTINKSTLPEAQKNYLATLIPAEAD